MALLLHGRGPSFNGMGGLRRGRLSGLGDLGWGIPTFVTEGLNPLHHLDVTKNIFTHPVDTFKAQTGGAVANVLNVAAPWVGGPGGVTPQSAVAAVNASRDAAAAQTSVLAACGFFQRLARVFGAHPNCL